MDLIKSSPQTPNDSPPLLFIHGMWHGAWCWKKYYMDWFSSKGFTCYALNLRGHGKNTNWSRRRINGISINQYVDDIRSAVEEIGEPPILIGHSMGGFLAQKYLVSHKAPAAVLLAPVSTRGIWGPTLRVLARRPLLLIKIILTFNLKRLINSEALTNEFLFSGMLVPELAQEYWGKMGHESFRAYLAMLGFNLVKYNRITTPISILGASKDGVIPLRSLKKTAKLLNADMEVLEETPHDIMLCNNWEKGAEKILHRIQHI